MAGRIEGYLAPALSLMLVASWWEPPYHLTTARAAVFGISFSFALGGVRHGQGLARLGAALSLAGLSIALIAVAALRAGYNSYWIQSFRV